MNSFKIVKLLIIVLGTITVNAGEQALVESVDLQNLDKILALRREVVSATALTNRAVAEGRWSSPEDFLGVIEKCEVRSKGREELKRFVVIRYFPAVRKGPVESKKVEFEIKGSRMLTDDWQDFANKRFNLETVNDDPFYAGRAFAFTLANPSDVKELKSVTPLPKVWVEEFRSAASKIEAHSDIISRQNLKNDEIKTLMAMLKDSAESIRCVAFAKMLNGGTLDGNLLAEWIKDSSSMIEAAVKTSVCLESNKPAALTALKSLCSYKNIDGQAVLGIVFASYVDIKTRRVELKTDLQTLATESAFKNSVDIQSLVKAKTRTLAMPSIQLLIKIAPLARKEDRDLLGSVLDAAGVSILLK